MVNHGIPYVTKTCKYKSKQTLIVSFMPILFDNKTVMAKSEDSKALARKYRSKVINWYKNHIWEDDMFTVESVKWYKNYPLRITIKIKKQLPMEYIKIYVQDPDDDGNYPLKGMLVSSMYAKTERKIEKLKKSRITSDASEIKV